MTSRFVRPDTKTLTLANGDTLLVKRRMNHGEQRDAFLRMRSNAVNAVDAMIVAYLLDWSLTDDDGRPIVIRDRPADEVQASLDNLDPDDFQEIKRAIEDHETAVMAERDAEKKQQGGEKESSATSPSPDAVAGATSGSET